MGADDSDAAGAVQEHIGTGVCLPILEDMAEGFGSPGGAAVNSQGRKPLGGTGGRPN